MSLRIADINREITKRWPGVELVKGEGYFYLIGDSLDLAYSTSIYAFSVNQLTKAQWMSVVTEIMEKARG